MRNSHKQLTNRDVVFGIGRKATKEELQEYLDKPVGKFVDTTIALNEIKTNLEQRRNKRKAS